MFLTFWFVFIPSLALTWKALQESKLLENPETKSDSEESCDHEWAAQDESFDHEFGTEVDIFWQCQKCLQEKPMLPSDFDVEP